MRPILLVFGLLFVGNVDGGRTGPPKVPLPAPAPADDSGLRALSAVEDPPVPDVPPKEQVGPKDVPKPRTSGGRPPGLDPGSPRARKRKREAKRASRSLAPASPVSYLASFFHGGLRAALSAPPSPSRTGLHRRASALHLCWLPRWVASSEQHRRVAPL